MSRGPILVTGATGFIGTAVLAHAARRQFGIRALYRHGGDAPSAGDAGIEWIAGDARDSESHQAAVADCSAVIHLAASHGSASEMQAVNVEATASLVTAAQRAGVRRFVHLSSATVSDGDLDPYALSKRAAEAKIRAADLPWVILRPTLVIGPGDRRNLPRFLERLRKLPVVPVPGRIRIQPVHVDDVAAAALAAIESPTAAGGTFELAGRDAIRYDDFLRHLAHQAGISGARVVAFPSAPLRIAAPLLDRITGSQRFSRLAAFYGRDHLYDLAPARAALDFRPAGLANRRPC